MKKFKNFILALILPRRTAKFRNMHFILALLIYLVAMFIAVSSQFIVSESMVKKEMPRSEYEETFKDYEVVGDYDKPELNFFVEKLEITSDTSAKIDPKDDVKKLTAKVLETIVENDTDSLHGFFAFSEDFTKSCLNNDEYSKEEEETRAYTLNRLKDLFKKAILEKNDSFISLFAKDAVYYGLNLDLSSLTIVDIDNATLEELITKFQVKTYDVISIDESFSYIRRLDNLDILGFVNQLVLTLGLELPTYNKVSSRINFDFYVDTYFKQKGIYHKTITKNGENLDLTLVIDANYTAFTTDEKKNKFEFFDYEGYFKQSRHENTTYILCVFSSDRFYFVYDLGQTFENDRYVNLDYTNNSIYETIGDKEVNRIYYLPASPSELAYNDYGKFDTTKWTKSALQNDQFDINNFLTLDDLPNNIKLEDVQAIKPVDRHQSNFYNAIYTIHSRGYNYNDFINSGFATSQLNAKINVLLQAITNSLISINAANYELIYGIMAFGIFVLFPLLLSLIIWLLSRKLVMNRYRQYYAIGSIAYIIISIVAFVIGFFVPFSKMAFPLMFVQAWYFIFITFRINTDPQYINNDSNQDNNSSTPSAPEFKKVKEHKSAQVG